MSYLVEEKEIENGVVKVFYDEDYSYLFEDEQLTTFASYTRYFYRDCGIQPPDSLSELKKEIKKRFDILRIEPLYLYQHSRTAISTSPFSCRWDSGQAGFAFITKDTWKSFMGDTKASKERLSEAIESDISYMNRLFSGDVYFYEIYDKEGDFIRSVGGYVGGLDICLKDGLAELE